MATIDITEATFDETITENEIVFVDFWADWCGPCRQFAPVYSATSEKHPDVVFAKVDTDANQGLAAAAGLVGGDAEEVGGAGVVGVGGQGAAVERFGLGEVAGTLAFESRIDVGPGAHIAVSVRRLKAAATRTSVLR